MRDPDARDELELAALDLYMKIIKGEIEADVKTRLDCVMKAADLVYGPFIVWQGGE